MCFTVIYRTANIFFIYWIKKKNIYITFSHLADTFIQSDL